jgi:hypothetical protein
MDEQQEREQRGLVIAATAKLQRVRMARDALCKVQAHNLCCLIQSMFELNVKPEF